MSMQLTFVEGDLRSFSSAIQEAMQAPLVHYDRELVNIRTGRASTALIENIMVDAYGQTMAMRDVATLGAPDSRMLTIQPWDKSLINAIEKAIRNSDLGINPVNDGEMIRLQLPMMSTERREEMVKLLGKKTEECRVQIRNIRKECMNAIRDAEKSSEISEDFSKRLQDALQKETDAAIKAAEERHEKKASDIRSI